MDAQNSSLPRVTHSLRWLHPLMLLKRQPSAPEPILEGVGVRRVSEAKRNEEMLGFVASAATPRLDATLSVEGHHVLAR